MAVQDPPMHLYNTLTKTYDSSKYRDYQTNGPHTAYIVWPAVALYERGPLFSKGVAEGTNELSGTDEHTGCSRKHVSTINYKCGKIELLRSNFSCTL